MRLVTLILTYYDNPGMLRRQYHNLADMSKALRSGLRLIVVDDGSPNAPAFPQAIGVPLEIYRMQQDVRWNQDACRNLAVHHAQTKWVLMTDIDHLPPEETLSRVVNGSLDDGTVYRFGRVSAPEMQAYTHHPNSWLMTCGMFDAIGGYDERFAGWYGTDGEFAGRVKTSAEIVQLKEHLIRFPREVIPDASTTTYERKTPDDRENITRIKAERLQEFGWKPKRLQFPYELVYSC